MKAVVITPKNQDEYKFINELLNKLGIDSSEVSEDDIEDLGLSKLLKSVDRKKSVMQKLK